MCSVLAILWLSLHAYASTTPAHLHMKFEADGYEPLTTALYFKGDEYLTS